MNAVFMRQLARFQRRMALGLFAKFALRIGAVSLVTIEAAVVAWHLSTGQAAIWFAAGGVASVLAAGMLAFAQTRHLERVAAALDRRLQLDDRIVSALQFRERSDAISRLIIQDAGNRLALCPPSAWAIELPARFHWLVGGVLGCSVVFAIMVGHAAVVPPQALSEGESAVSNARAAAGTTTQSAAAFARSALSNEIVAEPAGDRALRSTSPTDSARQADAVSRREQPTPRGETSTSGRMAQPPLGSASASASANSGRPNRRLDPDGDGSGPGGGSDVRTGFGAGGVKNSPPTEAVSRLRISPSTQSAYSDRYRRLWPRAEAALARDPIPAALRGYIRDYFAAIRPGGQQ